MTGLNSLKSMAETKDKTQVKKSAAKFFSGLGRRKRCVARVWLYADKGDILVNDKPIADLFTREEDKAVWVKPFHTVGISHPSAKFRGTIKVSGGGTTGRLEAISLGISRALLAFDPSFETMLKKQDLLKRDPREVEAKKYYLHKARRAPQYSKR